MKLDTPFNKSMVYIQTPNNIHFNHGICIWLTFNDIHVIDKFERTVLRIIKAYKDALNIDFKPFIQGKDSMFCYIELWNGNEYQDEMLKIIELVSIDMGCPFDIV